MGRFKHIPIFIMLTGLTACWLPETSNKISSSDVFAEELRSACYPGVSGTVVCIPTEQISKQKSESEGYEYLDPFSGEFPSSLNPNQYLVPKRFLDLQALNPDEKLSDNFQVNELMQDWKGRYGVFSPGVVALLQGIRNELGPIVVNSGYRSPGYNSGLNGAAKWSRHMYGDAIDMNATDVTKEQLADACEENGAAFTLIYRSHVHCDWRDSPLSFSFFDPSPEGVIPTVDLVPVATLMPMVQFGRVNLKVLHNLDEDHGELIYDWYIYGENGEVLESVRDGGTEFSSDFETDGLYNVEVLVGGRVPAKILIQVENGLVQIL